jgi:hypothetical protein
VDLVALEELRRLKYRYLRSLDAQDWETFADTLTDDVTADYGERLAFTGRDAVVRYLSAALPGIVTVHQCHHPELWLEGDEATGHWSLDDTVIVAEHRLLLRGAALYTDRYRRCADGAWRIASTGYHRLYEATMSLDDLPSLTFTGGPLAGRPRG